MVTTSTPVLASTLYAQEQEDTGSSNIGGGGTRDEFMISSEPFLRSGIKSLDRDFLISREAFGAGRRVVGFCGVGGELHVRSRHLIHNLIATHLLDSNAARSSSPSSLPSSSPSKQYGSPVVFIVEPPTTSGNETSLLHIYDILTAVTSDRKQHQQQERNSRSTNHPVVDIDNLIDRVLILPYFDLIGISQALTEISDSLHKTSGNSSGTIILLRDLGKALSLHTQTRSYSITQTAALLTQILRQLRLLAKYTHGHGRDHNTHSHQQRRERRKSQGIGVLVLVETGTPEAAKLASPRRTQHQQRQRPPNHNVVNADSGINTTNPGREVIDSMRLNSAFSSADGRYFRMRLKNDIGDEISIDAGTRANALDHPTIPDTANHQEVTLVRLIDDVLDGLVVVHDGFGVVLPQTAPATAVAGRDGTENRQEHDNMNDACIVEIMKDRMGCALGCWAVWNS